MSVKHFFYLSIYIGPFLGKRKQKVIVGINTVYRNWPWVQSGFFTMHTIVMMMKMHSYTALNGDLSVKLKRLQHLKAELPKLIKDNKLDDNEIEHTEAEIKFLEDEMVHGSTRFPNNITVFNFLDYLLVPTLVYWMEYPRTDK